MILIQLTYGEEGRNRKNNIKNKAGDRLRVQKLK